MGYETTREPRGIGATSAPSHRAVGAGQRPVDLARIIGVDRRSVRRWKAAHHREGARSSRARRASGRPPKLAPGQLRQVEQVLRKVAHVAGFPTDLWSCPRIAQVIARRFGVQYHVDHLNRLLRALGWSPQKPQRQAVGRDDAAIRGWIKATWLRRPKSIPSSSRPTRPSSILSRIMREAPSRAIRKLTGLRRTSISWSGGPTAPAGLLNAARISSVPSFATVPFCYASRRESLMQESMTEPMMRKPPGGPEAFQENSSTHQSMSGP